MAKFLYLVLVGIAMHPLLAVAIPPEDPCWKEAFHWERNGLVIVDPSMKDKIVDDKYWPDESSSITFGDLIRALGPAYVSPCNGSGMAIWKFQSGRVLRFYLGLLDKTEERIRIGPLSHSDERTKNHYVVDEYFFSGLKAITKDGSGQKTAK